MLQKLQEIFAFDNKKRDPYIQVYRETKIVYILEIIPPNYRLTFMNIGSFLAMAKSSR